MNEAAGSIMDVPNSPYFAHTLRRAIALAERHSHRLATPEHLLMALLDDPDAKDMLEGARADISVLRVKLGDVINRQMAGLQAPGVELRPSLEFDRVLTAAADLARRSPRGERDGAFVLAALVWEPEGPAAALLRHSGLSSEIAVAWLNAFRSGSSQNQTKAPPRPSSPQSSGHKPSGMKPPRPVAEGRSVIDSRAGGRSGQAASPETGASSQIASPLKPFGSTPLGSTPPGAGPLGSGPLTAPPPSNPPKRALELPRIEPAPLRPEKALPASRQESAGKSEETLEEMLARVRSILDDEDQPGPAAKRQPEQRQPEQRQSEAPAPRPAPAPMESLAPSAARAFHIRQPETSPPQVPAAPPPPAPAPFAPAPGAPSRGGPAPAPERQQPPLAFGGLPRSPASAAPMSPPNMSPSAPPPYRDPSTPPPIAPSRSLAPIPQRKPRSEMGKLVENIPRLMKVATPERVEVRLSREESNSLLSNFDGRGEIKSHNVVLTRAMSVMLRAPDGGFIIENLSPETQWIVDRPSFLETEPFGRWRWMVTPMQRGACKLLLIISARNVDENGMIGDTPLPDQVIEIRVQTNIRRSALIFGRWAALMAAGAILTESVLWTVRALIK